MGSSKSQFFGFLSFGDFELPIEKPMIFSKKCQLPGISYKHLSRPILRPLNVFDTLNMIWSLETCHFGKFEILTFSVIWLLYRKMLNFGNFKFHFGCLTTMFALSEFFAREIVFSDLELGIYGVYGAS